MKATASTPLARWLTLGNKGTAKAYCGLSDKTLQRAIRDKKIASHLVGHKRLIDRESLDAWIEGRSTQP